MLIAAGASGGHVYPALAAAEILRERGHQVSFAGGDRLEARLVPEAGFAFHPLPVRRPPSVRIELTTPKGIAAVASILRAVSRARRLIAELRPDVVLGMGGYPSIPVTLAAARSRLPLVLHEQNANLSFAQRVPLRWANVLALGLPLRRDARAKRTELVGHPVREALVELGALDEDARAAYRNGARSRLGLDASTPVLLVFGGSLGSVPLNEHVPTAPFTEDMQVLHLSGAGREDAVRAAWERAGRRAVVLGYLESIQDAYAAADVAVARSGASTVAELAITSLPSVLVPLPTLRRGDQEANARVLERAGGCTVILQSDPLFVERVAAEVSRVLADRDARAAMADRARSVARPDAADRLADVIERVVVRRP